MYYYNVRCYGQSFRSDFCDPGAAVAAGPKALDPAAMDPSEPLGVGWVVSVEVREHHGVVCLGSDISGVRR